MWFTAGVPAKHSTSITSSMMFGKKCYAGTNELLNAAFAANRTLVAVHRGVWGGNILGNTISAFRAACESGADMFELDVSKSTDGVLYAFHDGGEKRMLGISENIETLSSGQINELTYYNTIGEPSGVHLDTLESVIACFKNGELYNVDRAWDKLPETLNVIGKFPWAVKQALVKSPVREKILEYLNEYPQKFMYMPIVYSMKDIEKVLQYPEINTVGMELIAGIQAPAASGEPPAENNLFHDETIKFLHGKNLFVWVNAITLSCLPQHVLFGGLDDNTAMTKDKDISWGKLFEKEIDVIQTDWPFQLIKYRNDYFNKRPRNNPGGQPV